MPKHRRLSDATLLDYFNAFRKFSDFVGSDSEIETIGTDEIKQFLSLNSLN